MEAFVISEKWDKGEDNVRIEHHYERMCVLAFQHYDYVVLLCKINRKSSTSISICRYYLHSPVSAP